MPKKVMFTAEQLQELKYMIDSGCTQTKIAKHFDVTDDTIRRICKENDITVLPPHICTCEICGKQFRSNLKTAKYCKDKHIRKCVVCGKEFEVDISNIQQTCSRRCTNLRKYGTEWPTQSDSQKMKLVSSLQSKYGVCNVSQLPDHLSKSENTCLEKYGETNYAKTRECKQRIRDTNMHQFGVSCNLQLPSVDRSKGFESSPQNYIDANEAFKGKYGVDNPMKVKEFCQRQQQSTFEHYGVYHPSQSPEVARKCSTTRANILASDGTHLDSSYELLVYEYLLRNNISFKRQIPIEYVYEGKSRVTFIDFEIDGILFECKGNHLLHGCFDSCSDNVPIGAKINVYKHHHVVVITDIEGKDVFGKPNSSESNGFKYPNKCKNPLVGVDIELFKSDCTFPYREDRPKCFYNVKVDGQKSSHEAFYDEQLRWKMIINRIMYSGGFIDNNQILTAFNVTRTCKQPSWFSKTRAKAIIKKYCSELTIVDPFSGWGARHDASVELHRTYVGCDFNEELVSWHHSKGRNIQFKDAREFTYDDKCSVFICPPYSDANGRCFEDYNFEGFDYSAKQMTQCDWLKLVMQNVPNASEYVMVCKIIDEGWKSFIVDTICNRSHFGNNAEYVIVVRHKDRSNVLTNL